VVNFLKKICDLDNYTEKVVASIIHQVLNVINDLHKADIVHQDIKPENLLLAKKIRWIV